MDTAPVASPAVEEYAPQHFVSIRIITEDVPDLKKIMAAAAKLGEVKTVSYDKY